MKITATREEIICFVTREDGDDWPDLALNYTEATYRASSLLITFTRVEAGRYEDSHAWHVYHLTGRDKRIKKNGAFGANVESHEDRCDETNTDSTYAEWLRAILAEARKTLPA